MCCLKKEGQEATRKIARARHWLSDLLVDKILYVSCNLFVISVHKVATERYCATRVNLPFASAPKQNAQYSYVI